jgi:hypothetical protein
MKTTPLLALSQNIPFRMVCHMSGEKQHILQYVNEPLNLACVIVTTYRNGKPGKRTKEFGINERRTKGYKSLAVLLRYNPIVAKKAFRLYSK